MKNYCKVTTLNLFKINRKTKFLILAMLITVSGSIQCCKDDDESSKLQTGQTKKQDDALKKRIEELEKKLEDSKDQTDKLKKALEELKEALEKAASEEEMEKIKQRLKELEDSLDVHTFISTWTTNAKPPSGQYSVFPSKDKSGDNQIKLPLVEKGDYDFKVDWGDGKSDHITKYDDQNITHTYAKAGTYTLKIKGKLIGWCFRDVYSKDPETYSKSYYYGDGAKLNEISNWGCFDFGETEFQFYKACNMILTAKDKPKFTGTTSFRGTFSCNLSLTTVPNMNDWDVSKVTDMDMMFYKANEFNQDISKWDVSSVTNMQSMFEQDRKFNQPIGSWGTKTSNVITMDRMFYDALAFNQDISQWDVSSVKNMSLMFDGAQLFDQDLNQWNVSNVTDMSSMFAHALAFNGDISSWDVSNVTTMYNMFNGAHLFNGDLSRWDVSDVTNMQWTFYEADSFNSDISNWDVSKVKAMFKMFYNATSFDQNIGSWDVSKVFQMDDMFWGVTLSTQNYNALLKGFSEKGLKFPTKYSGLPKNLNFHGGFSKYTADYTQYRNILTQQKGWTIDDGGME